MNRACDFCLQEDETQSYKEGIYVSRVIEGGPADVDNGVQVEDRILEVWMHIINVVLVFIFAAIYKIDEAHE